jgi:hypothetical protein
MKLWVDIQQFRLVDGLKNLSVMRVFAIRKNFMELKATGVAK